MSYMPMTPMQFFAPLTRTADANGYASLGNGDGCVGDGHVARTGTALGFGPVAGDGEGHGA